MLLGFVTEEVLPDAFVLSWKIARDTASTRDDVLAFCTVNNLAITSAAYVNTVYLQFPAVTRLGLIAAGCVDTP